jgi:membrane protease YdiL (CAAX protease family)
MEKSGSSKPLIRQGWLRAVLCFIGFLILSGASLSFYFVVLHKGNPDVAGLADLMNDNNLLPVTGIFFITALLVCFVFRHWVDRKSFASIGLDINGHEGEAVAGLMLATFIVCASSLLLKWTGHLKWMDILFDLKSLFLAFGTIALIAFYEEVIFRGYILSNLMESFSKWLALVISVLLFMSFHWTARSSSGFFSLANLLIIGLILGLNFIYTRNLWFSISRPGKRRN